MKIHIVLHFSFDNEYLLKDIKFQIALYCRSKNIVIAFLMHRTGHNLFLTSFCHFFSLAIQIKLEDYPVPVFNNFLQGFV